MKQNNKRGGSFINNLMKSNTALMALGLFFVVGAVSMLASDANINPSSLVAGFAADPKTGKVTFQIAPSTPDEMKKQVGALKKYCKGISPSVYKSIDNLIFALEEITSKINQTQQTPQNKNIDISREEKKTATAISDILNNPQLVNYECNSLRDISSEFREEYRKPSAIAKVGAFFKNAGEKINNLGTNTGRTVKKTFDKATSDAVEEDKPKTPNNKGRSIGTSHSSDWKKSNDYKVIQTSLGTVNDFVLLVDRELLTLQAQIDFLAEKSIDISKIQALKDILQNTNVPVLKDHITTFSPNDLNNFASFLDTISPDTVSTPAKINAIKTAGDLIAKNASKNASQIYKDIVTTTKQFEILNTAIYRQYKKLKLVK